MSDMTLPESLLTEGERYAKAWKAWLASVEGKGCADSLPTAEKYLLNRLWHAFMAGVESGKVGQ